MNAKKAKLLRRSARDIWDYKVMKKGYKNLKPKQKRRAINIKSMDLHSKDNFKIYLKPHQYRRRTVKWVQAN